jgi:large subunit ribosomal protein L13
MTATKTFSPKPRDIERKWYVVDADGAVLGRLASEVAKVLRGKHKPIFAPHADTGDHVIVVNARGVRLTAGKELKKVWYRHSGYPGGLREIGYERLLADRPATAVEKAIKGMLPKNRLGRQMFKKLAVYEGPDHPHQAQKPMPLAIGEVPRWEGLPVPKPAAQPSPKPEAKETKRRAKPSPGRARTERGPAGGGSTRRSGAKGTEGGGRAARTAKAGASAKGSRGGTPAEAPSKEEKPAEAAEPAASAEEKAPARAGRRSGAPRRSGRKKEEDS